MFTSLVMQLKLSRLSYKIYSRQMIANRTAVDLYADRVLVKPPSAIHIRAELFNPLSC